MNRAQPPHLTASNKEHCRWHSHNWLCAKDMGHGTWKQQECSRAQLAASLNSHKVIGIANLAFIKVRIWFDFQTIWSHQRGFDEVVIKLTTWPVKLTTVLNHGPGFYPLFLKSRIPKYHLVYIRKVQWTRLGSSFLAHYLPQKNSKNSWRYQLPKMDHRRL